MQAEHLQAISPFRAGLKGCCPRCGKGKLFSGLLDVADACTAYGLDYSDHDSGDGPAVFVILILDFIVVGLAFWVEFTFLPPLWLHAVLWGPFIIIASVLMLRIFKATLVALQYRHHAGEGRVE
jgi:uncharacterized protein (DUF983 family)